MQVAYSALDGQSGGGALTLQGCTVVAGFIAVEITLMSKQHRLGRARSTAATASTKYLDLWSDRRSQAGGLRALQLSAVKPVIPRHFKCVEQALGFRSADFFSLRYGRPRVSQDACLHR